MGAGQLPIGKRARFANSHNNPSNVEGESSSKS